MTLDEDNSRGSGGRVSSAALATVIATTLAMGLAGCSETRSEDATKSIETVEVEAPPEIDLSNDPRAPARGPALAGILPDDFPADLPLHLPASLVDFDETAEGRSVSLLTHDPLAVTLRDLEAKARAAGWNVSPSEGGRRLQKAGRSVRLTVSDSRPGTLYRYVY